MRALERSGLRARLTAIATALVAVTLVAGGALLVLALRHSLLDGLDTSGRERAREIAALVQSDSLPSGPLAVGAGTAVAQVLDGSGAVAEASVGGDSLVPLVDSATVRRVRAGAAVPLAGSRVGLPDELRLVGVPAGSSTVLVAVSAQEARDTVRLVSFTVAALVPLAVLCFAVACWLVVGSSLRPVEALRRRADEITGAGEGLRLPVPPGRDEVHRLAVTLNGMIARLEESSRRQRAFVADAAHELRSPLAAVRTQVEVSVAHPQAAPWDETADGVLEDVARMTRLVDDLLLLARIDGAPETRDRPVTDLGAVVASVVGAVSSVGPRVPVTCDVAGDVRVRADADSLRRIVQNLVDNAVRHAATAVEAAACRHGDEVRLLVSDDGAGVPPEARERVFERFARLDDARSRDAGGTGLGLSIVRDLATASGGTAALEDGAPGARFVVRLPAALPVA
ncbi:signal transduction histidine kinase [Motilibacter peucedani]|uniref:histidine kinase n=1 Tax=Motilibacter peucedani TaxID=598650 RepID=A0A420XQ94_9ACTN|nr:ATP-binding protein [Motilibacter peucedani]RKS75429.1 signal transduction histidine kinase [Motilibacter peucedani]